MIKDLTEEEHAKLLTQEEVDRLPFGTKVWVKWSRGNGPYLYKVVKFKFSDRSYAYYGDLKSVLKLTECHLIDFVGTDKRSTSCWLLEGSQ